MDCRGAGVPGSPVSRRHRFLSRAAPALAPASTPAPAPEATESDTDEAVEVDAGSTDAANAAWPHDFVEDTVGGGLIDANDLMGQDLVLWFWAPW